MLSSVAEIFPQCTPVCESYHISTFPAAIDSGITQYFFLTTDDFSLQSRSSDINASLFASEDTCINTAEAGCRLHISNNGSGHFTGNFTCADVHNVRGENVVFVFEMESLRNGTNCLILKQSFVFENSKFVVAIANNHLYIFHTVSSVTQLGAELMSNNICIVSLEGCFPPCCGSPGTITRVAFGSIRYRLKVIKPCYKISVSMSNGDSSTIYHENLVPSLMIAESSNSNINLSLMSGDLDNLQNCFETCTTTIDIGRDLTMLNYTQGCFSANATLSPPEELMNHIIVLKSYKAFFTYCTEKPSDNVIHIHCVGFNPEDAVQEKIVLEISHSGVCMDAYSLTFGMPEMGQCVCLKQSLRYFLCPFSQFHVWTRDVRKSHRLTLTFV